MTIKIFFTIFSILALVFGIGFVLAPEQVGSIYGMEPSATTSLIARLFGGALLAWGLILWFARDFRDEAAVRAILIATGAADVVSLIVAVMGTLAHTTNALGWSTVLIYLLSALGCGYFLRAPSHKA